MLKHLKKIIKKSGLSPHHQLKLLVRPGELRPFFVAYYADNSQWHLGISKIETFCTNELVKLEVHMFTTDNEVTNTFPPHQLYLRNIAMQYV
jgi:hypothetical protein